MAQLCDPRLACAIWYRDLDIIWFALWKHVFGVFTICTTRCGFVNSVFGFAARKVSRHQLYKHVNAHVYLGVWRITLNSVQAVVGIHMIMSIKPFCVHNFRIPRFERSPNWILRIAISCYSGSGSTYSRLHLFRVRWKWPLGGGCTCMLSN